MKNKKVGIFCWIWYAILGFLIVGYILMPFFQTVLQAVQTEDGYSRTIFLKSKSEKGDWEHGCARCTVRVYLRRNRHYAGNVYDISGGKMEKGYSHSALKSDDDSGSHHCDFVYSALR